MGNLVSFSRNDIIYSAILIALWIAIRPFFVRMSEQAQAKNEQRLAAEAAHNDAQYAAAGGAGSRGGRKKLD